MLPFRRIVFPVDFSEACQGIVPYVVEMTHRYDAQLTLLRAFEPIPVVTGEFGTPALAAYPPMAELRRMEEETLHKFAREMLAGLSPQLLMEDGEAAAAIHNFVQRQGTDLIMMPTRGRGRLRRLLLGSITAKVLHDVSCAVWTGVGQRLEEHRPQIPYRSILCAVDTGEEAGAVIQAAASLAQSYNARLTLMHAVDTPRTAWDVELAPYRKMLMDSAIETMEKLRRESGVAGAVSVLEGSPGEAVRTAAIEHQADLAVVGRGHAQTAPGSWWSQLYSIVREAPCPVLSI